MVPKSSQNPIQLHLKITGIIESRLLHDRFSQKSIQTRKMAIMHCTGIRTFYSYCTVQYSTEFQYIRRYDIVESNPRARGARSCVLTIEPTRRRTSSRTLIQQYIYIRILGTVYSICNAQQLLYPLVWQNHIQNLYDENTYKNAPE